MDYIGDFHQDADFFKEKIPKLLQKIDNKRFLRMIYISVSEFIRETEDGEI